MTVRVTAGDEIGTSGITVPALHNFFWINDDSWGYTTTPSGSVHAGIETASMLDQRSAFRRYHTGFVMPNTAGHFASMEALIPNAAAAVGLSDPAVVPILVQQSSGSGANAYPIKTQKSANGKTAGSTNTSSVGGFKGVDRITNGEFDAPYTKLFTAMKTAMKGQPWGWLFWQEQAIPASNCYGGFQGGIDGTGQAALAAAAQHVITILRSVDPLAFSVQAITEYNPDNNKLSYWWGDSYVDFFATDNYRDSMARIQASHDFSVTHTVPFGLMEGGFDDGVNVTCFDGVHRDKDGRVTGKSLIEEMLTFADAGTVPNLCMLGMWNWQGSAGHDNRIDTTAASLAQYKALVNDAKVQSFYVPGGSPSLPPVNNAPPTVAPQAADTTSTLAGDGGDWTGASSFTYSWQKRRSSGTVTSQSGSTTSLGSLSSSTQYRMGVVAHNGVGDSNGGTPIYSEWTDLVATSPANGTTCDIISPVDGAQVAAGDFAAQALVSGPKGVSAVAFVLDGGSPVAGTSPGGNGNGAWTATLTLAGSDGSSHTLKATATPVTI